MKQLYIERMIPGVSISVYDTQQNLWWKDKEEMTYQDKVTLKTKKAWRNY